MATLQCPKCGNQTPNNQKVCIYCQAPISRSDPSAKINWKLKPRVVILIAVLIFAIKSLPDFVKLFRSDNHTAASSVTKPAPKNPPIEEKKPVVETTALAAYQNLTNAIDQDDEETARRYVNSARWNELELDEDDPSAIKELKPRCNVGLKFESQELDDRAVLSAKSTPIKDQDGQTSFTALIVKMAMEDDQWKVFSTSCYEHPSPDYMEEARAWLFEQSPSGNDLNSRLVATGLHDGEVSCFMAVKYKKPKAVKKCLETGWSVDAEDTDGRKAFDIALENIGSRLPEDNEMIELFVIEGANINRPNKEGMTPLMLAAIHCNDQAAKIFIDAGADIDYTTKKGVTSSKLAENCQQVTKLLRAAKTQ